MGTIIDLMLSIRERRDIFYHKDTDQFDYLPISEIEMKTLSPDAKITDHDTNNFRLPSYEEVDHEGIMRLYVKECVEDKAVRKKLFDVLRRDEFVDAFVDKLHELDLYDDFRDSFGDIYYQIFDEWADRNGLDFRG